MDKTEITFDKLVVAFERVKVNDGCPGVDRVTIEEFEYDLTANLKRLHNELQNRTYRPLPLLRILVDKGNGEARALCIPAVCDRVAQVFVLDIVEPVLDKEFEVCSFAYRKGHSVKDAVYMIKEYHEQGYNWVVDADIDEFFDSVDHELLLSKFRKYVHIPFIHELLELWLKTEVWDGERLTIPAKGIPQGSPVSPISANLFLDELDEEMLKKEYKIVRYSDDYIVLCKNKDAAVKALQLSKDVLERLLLRLDEEDIVNFNQGFEFLGVTFVRSLIMKPFDNPKKDHKIIHYPGHLDIKGYMRNRKK